MEIKQRRQGIKADINIGQSSDTEGMDRLRAACWAMNAAVEDQRKAAERFKAESATLADRIDTLGEAVHRYDRKARALDLSGLFKECKRMVATAEKWSTAAG